MGDGWMPLAYPPGEEARMAFATLHRYTEEAGRDQATIGIDTRVSAGAGSEAEWRPSALLEIDRRNPPDLSQLLRSGHLHRIAGRSLGDHIAAMRRYWNAVADLL
jgi:alkanesulfonate monooxygenase SsuD/methylene tetrahydromethanopterin reductase-like flavin-dependent oxidoreductase (luciferase family)